jgi:hypothetical protein
LEYHDSWLEALSGIQPQLVLQNFVEETVEEDWEIVLVVDLQTELRTELLLERRLLVENPPELKLLAFLIELDVLSEQAY